MILVLWEDMYPCGTHSKLFATTQTFKVHKKIIHKQENNVNMYIGTKPVFLLWKIIFSVGPF